MSVTPGLGSFNKDKVANKFGIELKNNSPSDPPDSPSTPERGTPVERLAEHCAPDEPKRTNVIPPVITSSKTEHQKDQPLYKRQLSKSLENAAAATQKNKHSHELSKG